MNGTGEPAARGPGVRERTRAAIKGELGAAAVRLFTERGFAETTARDIAREVGVSERTFFRYFASKEDVVFGAQEELGPQLAARLSSRPAREVPFVALRRSFDVMTETLARDPEWSLTMLRLTRRVPSLRARQVEKQDQWAGQLAEVLAARLSADADSDLRPSLYAATALSALDVAVSHWEASDRVHPLGRILDDAFSAAFGSP